MTKKATQVLDKMKDLLPKADEQNVGKPEPEGSNVGSADSLKPMDNVTFKKGTEHEGQLARVVDVNKGQNTVNLKMGSATLVDIPVSDLLLTDASAA